MTAASSTPATGRRVVAACVVAGVSAAPLVNIFSVQHGAQLIASATLPAAVVAALSARVLPGSSALRWMMQLVAVIVGVLVPVSTATSDPFGPEDLRSRLLVEPGAVWRRTLSIDLPVPFSHTFVDAFALYLAVAVVVVAGLAMSSRPVLALVPGMLLFGALLALGVHGPISPILLACVFLLGAALLMALSAHRVGVRRSPAGVLALCVALLVGGGVAMFAPLHEPLDPRHDVVRPVDLTPQDSPLAKLSSLLRRPSTTAFVAAVAGGSAADLHNWVLASYDSYSGDAWSTTITADPVGAEGDPTTAGSQSLGRVAITLDAPAQLLPHQPAVDSAGPEGLRYDPASETLVAARPTRSYSAAYRVTSPSVADLSAAAIPSGLPSSLTTVPSCTPPALLTLAKKATADAVLPDEKAVALQQAFTRAPYVFDPDASPGDGCARLTEFMGTHHGTSEQFATAYALAARSIGLPARMVVGFGPGNAQGSKRVVTNADARAWVQIKFTGIGWTDFEPTPAGKGAYTRPSAKQPALAKIQKAVAGGNITPTAQLPPTQTPPRAGASHTGLIAAGAIGLLVILLLFPTAVRATRRWWWRRADVESARVLAAWWDVLAVLRLHDVDTQFSTAPQIARAGASVLRGSADRFGSLSLLAERAVYAEPISGDGDRSWAHARWLRRQLAQALPWRKRLTRAILSLT